MNSNVRSISGSGRFHLIKIIFQVSGSHVAKNTVVRHYDFHLCLYIQVKLFTDIFPHPVCWVIDFFKQLSQLGKHCRKFTVLMTDNRINNRTIEQTLKMDCSGHGVLFRLNCLCNESINSFVFCSSLKLNKPMSQRAQKETAYKIAILHAVQSSALISNGFA